MITAENTGLEGLKLLRLKRFGDSRGAFQELWQQERYSALGLPVFVQDNLSYSSKKVLRGLHFQQPHSQGKLVSVLEGQVFDVVVDIRPESETFGQWKGFTLSEAEPTQLFIPQGFAHGFCVLSERAIFHYRCTDFYSPQAEKTILYSDPALGIDWPVSDPVVSEKDQKGLLFGAFKWR